MDSLYDLLHGPQSRLNNRESERTPVRTGAGLAMLGAVGLGLAVAGCAETYTFYNAVPYVASVGPVCVDDDGRAWVFFSLVDFEADPVDVTFEWVNEDGSTTPATEWLSPGEAATAPSARCGAQTLSQEYALSSSHGTTGLPSAARTPAPLHLAILDWREVDADTTRRLRIIPDDREGGVGLSLDSGALSVDTGTATVAEAP